MCKLHPQKKSALHIIKASHITDKSRHRWSLSSWSFWFRLTWMFSDIGENIAREEAHKEHARKIILLMAAFALQMECVIILQVWNICHQSHLTQEWVRQDIFVVNLWGDNELLRKWIIICSRFSVYFVLFFTFPTTIVLLVPCFPHNIIFRGP